MDEREHFRLLMRMCEKSTGCRVLSYCLMSNHFHLLLEVPLMPEGGIPDQEPSQRLEVFYSEAQVAEVAKKMQGAALVWERGEFELPSVAEMGIPLAPAQEMAMAKLEAVRRVEEIRSPYTRGMHGLSKFMKSLLERFTKWFNRAHSRSGTLWEDRFRRFLCKEPIRRSIKSVMVKPVPTDVRNLSRSMA
jgi:hypothetical protein